MVFVYCFPVFFQVIYRTSYQLENVVAFLALRIVSDEFAVFSRRLLIVLLKIQGGACLILSIFHQCALGVNLPDLSVGNRRPGVLFLLKIDITHDVDEQKGARRAEYGDALINELAKKLTFEFGKGFTATN